MATYALTVSTNALGLGVINGATIVVDRKRTSVTDIYPTSSLYTKKIATNVSGIAVVQLNADDGSVFHEIKIFDVYGVLVYKNTIQMPPQAVDIEDLPLNDIITESAQQAVAASVTATEQAVISTAQAVISTAQAVIATTQAGIATTQAGLATTNGEAQVHLAEAQAVIATDKAVLTAADRVQTALDRIQTGLDVIAAQEARDAAILSGNIFASTAAGHAGTADGEYFSIPSASATGYLDLYLRSGATDVFQDTYPSIAALAFVSQFTEMFAFGAMPIMSITDSTGSSLATWLADGILRAKFGLEVDPTSPITFTFSPTTGLTTVSLTTARLETAEQYIDNNKVIGSLTDVNRRAYLAMFENGRTYIPKLLVDELVSVSGVDLASMFASETTEQYIGANKVIGSLTDSGRRAYLAMFENGQTYIPKLTVGELTIGGTTGVSIVNSAHQSDFVIYGDSLSIPGGGTGFSQAFAALYPSRTTYIQGVSGQQSWDIAARVGRGVTCSVSGGVIPTSGSVTLTGWSGATTVYGVLGSAAAGIYAANARLYGVEGVLSVDATNTHTFTPSSYPAAPIPVPTACPLQVTGQTVYGTTDTSSSLTLDEQNSAIAILWLGRNDFRYAGYSQAATLENIAAAYAQLKNVHRHVLVLGTINGEYDLTAARSPTVGGSPSDAETQRRLDANAALRVALAQTYGYNYLGMQEALEVMGYANSWTINGTTYQILNNTLLPDGVHPNGNQSIIAGIVQSRITAKGW